MPPDIPNRPGQSDPDVPVLRPVSPRAPALGFLSPLASALRLHNRRQIRDPPGWLFRAFVPGRPALAQPAPRRKTGTHFHCSFRTPGLPHSAFAPTDSPEVETRA